jgi:acetoin utilization protein AcuB
MPPFIWIDHGNYSTYVPRVVSDKLHRVHGTTQSTTIKDRKLTEQKPSDYFEGSGSGYHKEKDPYKATSDYFQTDEHPAIKVARQIMTSQLITVFLHTTIQEVLRLFSKNQIRHIPVVDETNKLLGIASERDILRWLAESEHPKEHSMQIPIQEVMHKKVLTIRPEAKVPEIARVMVEEKIGCMPVLNEENKLIGLVTRGDVLNLLVYSDRLNINV